MNFQIDISDIISTIRVPTLVIHRTEDVLIKVEGGRYLAQNIPGARYIELPGKDHFPSSETTLPKLQMRLRTSYGLAAAVAVDRVLATVLFTDIVGSTEKAVALGDNRWHDLLDATMLLSDAISRVSAATK